MKRSLMFVAVAFAVLVFAAGCDMFGADRENYFPWAFGSSWLSDGCLTFEQVDGPETLYTSRQYVETVEMTYLTTGEEVAKRVVSETTFALAPIETTYVVFCSSYVRRENDRVLTHASLDDLNPDTLLVFPLKLGKTWTVEAHGDTTTIGEVVGRETVTVAAGTFPNCWKVNMTHTAGSHVIVHQTWYADGIGQVKYRMDVTGDGVRTVIAYDLVSADVQ